MSLLVSVLNRLSWLKQLASSLWIKSLDNQLPSSLILTTFSRLVIIKPEQVMRTHPDISKKPIVELRVSKHAKGVVTVETNEPF